MPLTKYQVVDCACGRVGNELEPDADGYYCLAADVETMLKEDHATCIKLADEARRKMDIDGAQEYLYGAFVINSLLAHLKGQP